MKTIITSTSNTAEAKFDLHFGRAGWFCLYDHANGTTKFIENANKNANGGAGTKSAEMIAELGADKVVSGDFGPKAKSLLETLKIQMIIIPEKELTVQEIIEKIK